MKYLIFCWVLFVSGTFHPGHIAEYFLQLEGTDLKLKFVIEKEELMGFELGNDCDLEKMTALCTAQYLNHHLSVKINDEKVKMELQNSFTEQDHLIINLSSKLDIDTIEEISISNDCFYEFNSRFKNRIIIDIAHFQKSFLLNKKRNSLHLK